MDPRIETQGTEIYQLTKLDGKTSKIQCRTAGICSRAPKNSLSIEEIQYLKIQMYIA